MLEGLEEAPTRTIPDGKGEDGQSENADFRRYDHSAFVGFARNAHMDPERRYSDSQEEHRGRTQPNPFDLPLSQVHSHTDQQKGEKNVVVCQVLQYGFHEWPPMSVT